MDLIPAKVMRFSTRHKQAGGDLFTLKNGNYANILNDLSKSGLCLSVFLS
jgi:hypothetical protein